MSTSVTLSLTPEVEKFIDEKVSSGAYPTVNDAITHTLRMRQLEEDIQEAKMQALTEAERDTLRREIQKGIDSHARGDYTTVDGTSPSEQARKIIEESKRRLEVKLTAGIK